MTVTLDELVRLGLVTDRIGDGSVVLRGASQDSRRIQPGDVFLALSGARTDGARFASDAVARGAVAVIGTGDLEGLGVPTARFSGEPRAALLGIASQIYGDPTRALFTIGITGTNGKTTTTWLIDEALGALGHRPALLGTVEARGPGFRDPSALTTPEGDAIDAFARRMLDAGATHLVMEVSSHALAQKRADGVAYEVVGFTNLTQDHLDFHGTMEAYFEAKARLFMELAAPCACVNVDDAWGRRLAATIREQRKEDATLMRVSSRGNDAEVRTTSVTETRSGLVIDAETPFGPLHVESPLLGGHNVDNLLLAAACLLASPRITRPTTEALGRALSGCKGAPGRLERVPDRRDVAILVDYAHSPDALEKALVTLRPITPGRLFCVFGCGGDRDKGKRPLMGAVVDARADVAVVTSDNPRTEDPLSIIDMILPGLSRLPRIEVGALASSARGQTVAVDRRAAIGAAIGAARAGDTVLIAGKGHEDYQILGTEKIHFDDREEARAAVAAAGGLA